MIITLLFAILSKTPVLQHPAGAFFALSVADASATARWYRDELGFTIVHEGEAPNRIAKGVLLQHGDCILEIVQHSEAKPPATKDAFKTHGIFRK